LGFVRLSEFEHRRDGFLRRGKPLAGKEMLAIRDHLVAAMESLPDLIVQKAKQKARVDMALEITAIWVGANAEPNSIGRALRGIWPDEALAAYPDITYTVAVEPDVVHVPFVIATGDRQFLAGQLLVTL